MPATAHRSSRGRRRAMSEINMVPFIDVMLVLLIIFMVSAPLITTGVVDVPSVGQAKQRPAHVVEVIVTEDDNRIKVRVDGGESERMALADLVAHVEAVQQGDAQVPVVISAERSVRYERVVRVMDTLQRGGVQRVGLTVKQGGGGSRTGDAGR